MKTVAMVLTNGSARQMQIPSFGYIWSVIVSEQFWKFYETRPVFRSVAMF